MLTLDAILDGLTEDQVDLVVGSDLVGGGGSRKCGTKTTRKTTKKTYKTGKSHRCDP